MARRAITAAAVLLLAGCSPEPGDDLDESWEAELEQSFREFAERTIYSELTEEVLASIPDDELEQALVDYVLLAMDQADGSEVAVVRDLNPGLRAVFATWVLEGEVINGGYLQFYLNSSHRFVDDAIEGFELIDAPEFARLTRRSLRPETRDGLDREFHALDEAASLSASRVAFVRRHPELCTAPAIGP